MRRKGDGSPGPTGVVAGAPRRSQGSRVWAARARVKRQRRARPTSPSNPSRAAREACEVRPSCRSGVLEDAGAAVIWCRAAAARRRRPPGHPSTPWRRPCRCIDRDDSLLVVVDLQPKFWSDRLDKDDAAEVSRAAARAAWLAGTAMALDVPAVLTEESPERNGPTAVGSAAGRRPQGARVHQAGLRPRRLPGDHGGHRGDRSPDGRALRLRDRRLRDALGRRPHGSRLPRGRRRRRRVLPGGRAGLRPRPPARPRRRARALQGRLLRLGAHARCGARLRARASRPREPPDFWI